MRQWISSISLRAYSFLCCFDKVWPDRLELTVLNGLQAAPAVAAAWKFKSLAVSAAEQFHFCSDVTYASNQVNGQKKSWKHLEQRMPAIG
jgi:hypothetical protein